MQKFSILSSSSCLLMLIFHPKRNFSSGFAAIDTGGSGECIVVENSVPAAYWDYALMERFLPVCHSM